MENRDLDISSDEAVFAVDNWPMRLDALRGQLKSAQKLLRQYRAGLHLARVEIELRNRCILALTNFAYQSGHVASPTTLLKLALARTLEITGSPVGAVVLIDPETKGLILGVHKGLTTELTHILTGQELGAGAAVLMPHLSAGLGALLEYGSTDDQSERALLDAGRMTSLVSVPLQSGSQLLGALLVGLHGERRFKPAELRFIMAIAQETAVALEGLRLRSELWHTTEALLDGKLGRGEVHVVEQAELDLELLSLSDMPATALSIPQTAEEDLEQLLAAMMQAEAEARQQNADLLALNDIAELMNRSLDLKQILVCTVDQTRSVSKADAAWIYLAEEDNRLVMRAHTGLSPDYVRGMRSLRVGDGLEGRVAAENEAHFIESTSEDVHTHKIWVEKEGLRALAAVPVTRPEPGRGGDYTQPHVVGVLAVGIRVRQTRAWGSRERWLLTSIANHVALAIDNARLYATVQVDEAGMRAGNQVLQEINDMLLQRNACLEGLIRDDLIPALTSAARIVYLLQTKNIAPLTDTEIGVCAGALENAIDGLGDVTREIADESRGLDGNWGRSPDAGEDRDHDCQPADYDRSRKAGSRLMSFEQAVAAGLVPAHLSNQG